MTLSRQGRQGFSLLVSLVAGNFIKYGKILQSK